MRFLGRQSRQPVKLSENNFCKTELAFRKVKKVKISAYLKESL